jgi:hypothetical protein
MYMNISGYAKKVFANTKSFLCGIVYGMVFHKVYGSQLSEKLIEYDSNKDGKLTYGEILDGTINDVKSLKNNGKDTTSMVAFTYKNIEIPTETSVPHVRNKD